MFRELKEQQIRKYLKNRKEIKEIRTKQILFVGHYEKVATILCKSQ